MSRQRSSRIEWVVFDLGETLADETRNWANWADHLGVPTLTLFAAMGAVMSERRPHTDAFELIRPGFDFMAERDLMDATGRAWSISVDDLYPDALPTLAELREAGYKVAIMANQPKIAESLLADLPVDRFGTSAGWGVAKPDPRFFDRVVQEVGAPAESIAYVGDRIDNDVLPAKAAGMLAIHLRRGPWGIIQSQWPEAVEADLRIDKLTSLPPVLAVLSRRA